MDKRHEFVSNFIEYCRSEVIKKWASNLGMITPSQSMKSGDLRCKEIYNRFRNMSCYGFSQWKMNESNKNDK